MIELEILRKIMYNRTQFTRTLVIRIGLALLVNLSRILQNLSCLELTSYPIKSCIVLWLLELKIRRGRNV